MIRLAVMLQMLLKDAGSYVGEQYRTLRSAMRDERGSVTMEQVLWAVAMIAIVAIAVAAITSFITTKASEIR
ncbi:MAG: hypothetical protein QM286_13025 [Acidobacteriota bacterium]|nr:hypothetical protein [Acidobacteriota bacterium]